MRRAWAPLLAYYLVALAWTWTWLLGLFAGAVVLGWLYVRSSSSILLVALWHTAYNFTAATEGTSGTIAAASSTVVMLAAVVIVVLEARRRPARR